MDNYKEIKNYIHNDLKISKADINKIIQLTVATEIRNLMKDKDFIDKFVYVQLQRILSIEYENPAYKRLFNLNDEIFNSVANEISKIVKERIQITLLEDDRNERG